MFEGCMPHMMGHERIFMWQGWAAAYYTLAPKVGSVCTGGNVERHIDFSVNPVWILNLVEAQN